MSTREPRDQRGPDDPRDQRDQRLEGDPRDVRDVRLPGDLRDEGESRWAWTRSGALKLTSLILVLFLVDFFWSTHTKDVAVSTAQHAQQVSISRVEQALRQVENSVAASCDFIRPLTSLPTTVSPATGKASELSVQIVAGAREQYVGQCVGRGKLPLPPPDPSFVRWANYYHIQVVP